MNWPPDYFEILKRRRKFLDHAARDRELQKSLKIVYKNDPIKFIEDWCTTYDPRAPLTTMPFILFPRQKEFILFLLTCLTDKESGLAEKSREVGATYLCCAFSIWLWLFHPGISVGWGSRVIEVVDRLGDPSSIFEKMRMMIKWLPPFLLPVGFSPDHDMTYMRIINQETGSSIIGSSGKNIGRGGRTSIFFKDESAHYENPESIEAALADNTNVQIDISSVSGSNNIFYRRRQAGVIWNAGEIIEKGKVRVFIFDWRDHPEKTQAWYDRRRERAEREGLLHIIAQELDRDYTAATEGIIIPQIWVNACVDAHIRLGFQPEGVKIAMLDVADEGGDKNALAIMHGSVLVHADHWGQGDTGVTARRAVNDCKLNGVYELYYDCIGVGAGIKSETNRLTQEGHVPKGMRIQPWNPSSDPLDKDDNIIPGDRDSPTNGDIYHNLKAQAWWRVRIRCEKTYKAVTQNIYYPPEELISFPSGLPRLHEVKMELSQAVRKTSTQTGKMLVDKKPDGATSPNLADGVIGAANPTRELSILDVI